VPVCGEVKVPEAMWDKVNPVLKNLAKLKRKLVKPGAYEAQKLLQQDVEED
jgi:hypothetical protein